MRPNDAGLEGLRDTAGSVASGTRAVAGADRTLSAATTARATGAEKAGCLTTSAPHEFCIASAPSAQRRGPKELK